MAPIGPRREFRLLLAAGLATCGMTGCAGLGDTGDAGAELDLMGPEYASVTSLAEGSDDASDEQKRVLREAAEGGELTYNEYSQAVTRTMDCMRDAGIEVIGPLHDDTWGYPRLSYVAKVGYSGQASVLHASDGPDVEIHASEPPRPVESLEIDPQALIAEQCREVHSVYIEYAYDAQPSSLETHDAILEAKRGAVAQCAREHGLVIDEGLPIREFLFQLVDTSEGRLCLQDYAILGF